MAAQTEGHRGGRHEGDACGAPGREGQVKREWQLVRLAKPMRGGPGRIRELGPPRGFSAANPRAPPPPLPRDPCSPLASLRLFVRPSPRSES